MSGVAVHMETDAAVAGMAQLREGKFLRGANARAGKRVEVELRRYFAARPRNKKGWRSAGFWRSRIRNATALTRWDERGATITIADPAMAQKVYGGSLRPREAKFLTIPARPEAYGRSARTFSDLVFIPMSDFRRATGGGKLVGMLVRKPQGRAKKLVVFYYCVASVWQPPDKNALPSKEHFGEWVSDEFAKYIARLAKNGGAE